MAAPNGAGPLVGGTGNPAQSAVTTQGASAGDGNRQRHKRTSRGDRESRPVGGRCLWSTYVGMAPPRGASPLVGGTGNAAQLVVVAYGAPAEGWHPPTARAQWLGGWGVLPSRWSTPLERLRGGGGGAMARGHWLGGRGVLPTWWPLRRERVRGDGSPEWRGPTGWGDRESCPVASCCLWSVRGGGGGPQWRAATG